MQRQIARLERQLNTRAAASSAELHESLREMTETFRAEQAKRAAEAAELALPPDERAKLAAAQFFDKLDLQLGTSIPDPAWRPEATAREAVARFQGTRVDDVKCGPAHCRVELSFANATDWRKLNDEIGTVQPFSEGVAFDHDPTTPLRARLYFQRPGVPLGDAP